MDQRRVEDEDVIVVAVRDVVEGRPTPVLYDRVPRQSVRGGQAGS